MFLYYNHREAQKTALFSRFAHKKRLAAASPAQPFNGLRAVQPGCNAFFIFFCSWAPAAAPRTLRSSMPPPCFLFFERLSSLIYLIL
jgi:hypothetical protein